MINSRIARISLLGFLVAGFTGAHLVGDQSSFGSAGKPTIVLVEQAATATVR